MSTRGKAKPATLDDAVRRAKADVPAARHIPFATHVSPSIIKLRDNGDLCCTWRLMGIPFQTASVEEIAAAKNQLVNFIHSLRGTEQAEPTALWFHRVRRKAKDRLRGQFPSAFAEELDRKYWERIGKAVMLRSEHYFTVVVRPTRTATGLLSRFKSRKLEDRLQADRELLERFETLCSQVDAAMPKYGGQRLACTERTTPTGNKALVSPTLSFFSWLLTGVYEDVVVQEGPIYNYLCAARIFPSDSTGILQMEHPSRRSFVGYLDLQDYPAVTEPGLNNCLFAGSYEFVETQSFSFLTKREGVAAIERQQKRLQSSGEGSEEQVEEMHAAVEDVQNGRVFIGEYHYTLGVIGASIAEVRSHMANARNTLQDQASYKVATIDLVPECAHFAQLPGSWKWRPREAKLTSRNLASLSPLHNFDLGKRDGNPWGQAITMFETPSRQGYYANFHDTPVGKNRVGQMDPGVVLVTGKTGTGKSVGMGFLFNQATKVPRLRGVILDKDRGSEAMVRAMNGRYRQLRRGQPTGFNPFQWVPTKTNVAFVQGLIKACATREGEQLPASLENKLTDAVARVMALPNKADRRISAILQFVGEDSELGERLSKWCRTSRKTGANAWVLDNGQDTMDFSQNAIFGFDYTEIIKDEECGPVAIAYILQSFNALLNGQPLILVMEEFATLLATKSQTIAELARDSLTTIRKNNGVVIFVTQSPSQVKDHPIAPTLREQTATLIAFPNPNASFDDYIGFGYSPTEYETIKAFEPDSRMLLFKQAHRSAVCRLDLGGMNDELDVISGSKEKVQMLDEIRAELRSDDPADWLPVYLERCRLTRVEQPVTHTA
jgi:type IV secretion system protein VirB4